MFQPSYRNNFDLIRLTAAAQVMVLHTIEHVGRGSSSPLVDLISRFPGVPVFFVVSGFLVTQSFERSSTLASYSRKRALRIFPALYVCLALTITSVLVIGYLPLTSIVKAPFLLWLGEQLTFLQFLRSPLFNDLPTHSTNGSLWTIPVELQFYILLPLLFAFRRAKFWQWMLAGMLVLSAIINLYRYSAAVDTSPGILLALLKMSLAPYLYMFLIGTLAHLNFARIRPLIEGKFVYWLAAYIAASYGMSALGFRATENGLGLLNVIVLAGLTLSAAYTMPTLADRLLKRNDISYGVYIYHVPVMNVLLFLGGATAWTQGAITIAVTVLLAVLSWIFVEKPAIGLKSPSRASPA